jgi:hypothetical protein
MTEEEMTESPDSAEIRPQRKRRLSEAQHIKRIARALNREAGSVIDAGEALRDAHDQLFSIIPDKGTRTQAWAKWLEYHFGMTRGTASKYMSIAARGTIFRKYLSVVADVSPGKHEHYLPTGMTALYELSTIRDDDLLESLIHSGECAGLTKEKARELAREARGEETGGRKASREAREAWDLECEARFRAAEEATNGYLIAEKARADGINPHDIFRRPDRIIRKHATEELRDWLDGNPGTPRQHFIRQHAGADRPKLHTWGWHCQGCWKEFHAEVEGEKPSIPSGDIPESVCADCLKILREALRGQYPLTVA